MTPEELAGWLRFARIVRDNVVTAVTPCDDCTPEFAEEQRAAGLCRPVRYCVRCRRWLPDDGVHWPARLRHWRYCLACRQRWLAARWYRTRYRTNAAFRERELARARARRTPVAP